MTLLSTEDVAIEGRRLRVARLDQSAGAPVVLLHGYPENLQLWSKLAPALAERHAVIAFDWPGMGASETWPGGAAPHQQAERLLRILDALDVARCHVVGADMGGQPALVFAAQHPERTRSVTVMNSLLFGDEETSWEIRLLRKHGFNVRALSLVPRVVFLRARLTFLARPRALDRELADSFWGDFRRPEVRHFISRMCAGYQGSLPRLPTLYARIRAPIHALWGEHDQHFPPTQAEALKRLRPDTRLSIVPGGEHWMMIECWEDVLAAMVGFYEDV